ncbi:TetR family transcriptional regulator [Leucobacter japonicus]|uniref:TetR family transcriptional regulator n=1 Tax=Leucobacter japonicus TaxID=1461259 RepID=UPI0006A78261|nr:TetR family transcriptional regulator [Leucobacter japonicus]
MRNTLADVVSTALEVLDDQGLEGCSMRRVAAALDVQPSALYHHVPNKQSLLALMADEIAGGVLQVEAGAVLTRDGAPVGPADRARFICLALRGAMLDIRDGADVVATAAAFRLGDSAVEDRLAELIGADGARTILLFTFGHTQSTQTHRQAAALGALGSLVGRADAGAANGAGSDRGAGDDAAADPALDLDASFERGLDIILAGLER